MIHNNEARQAFIKQLQHPLPRAALLEDEEQVNSPQIEFNKLAEFVANSSKELAQDLSAIADIEWVPGIVEKPTRMFTASLGLKGANRINSLPPRNLTPTDILTVFAAHDLQPNELARFQVEEYLDSKTGAQKITASAKCQGEIPPSTVRVVESEDILVERIISRHAENGLPYTTLKIRPITKDTDRFAQSFETVMNATMPSISITIQQNQEETARQARQTLALAA